MHDSRLAVKDGLQPRSWVRANIQGGIATITVRLASGRLLLGCATGLRKSLRHCVQLAAGGRLHAVCLRIVGQGGDLPQTESEAMFGGAMEHLGFTIACESNGFDEDLYREIGELRSVFMQVAEAEIPVVSEIRGRLRDTIMMVLACSNVVFADYRTTMTVVYGHPGAAILKEVLISKGLESSWEMLAGGYRLSATVAERVRLVSHVVDADGQESAPLEQWVHSHGFQQSKVLQLEALDGLVQTQSPDPQPNHLGGVPGKDAFAQSVHAWPHVSEPLLPEVLPDVLLKAPPASTPPLIGECSTTGSSCSSNPDGNTSSNHDDVDLMTRGMGVAPQGRSHDDHVWGAPAPTTMIIRHLPTWMTLGKLAAIIDAMGFNDTYDVLHLPQGGIPSVPRDTCLGYGFINIPDPRLAAKFANAFSGYNFEGATRKACVVSPSVLQGKEASLSRMNKHADVHPSRLPFVRDLHR